jgi:hypothetical protein
VYDVEVNVHSRALQLTIQKAQFSKLQSDSGKLEDAAQQYRCVEVNAQGSGTQEELGNGRQVRAHISSGLMPQACAVLACAAGARDRLREAGQWDACRDEAKETARPQERYRGLQ